MTRETEQRLLYRVAALLLEYPDPELLARLPELRHAVGALPAPAGAALERLITHLEGTPLPVLTAHIDQFIAGGGKGPYPEMEK